MAAWRTGYSATASSASWGHQVGLLHHLQPAEGCLLVSHVGDRFHPAWRRWPPTGLGVLLSASWAGATECRPRRYDWPCSATRRWHDDRFVARLGSGRSSQSVLGENTCLYRVFCGRRIDGRLVCGQDQRRLTQRGTSCRPGARWHWCGVRAACFPGRRGPAGEAQG